MSGQLSNLGRSGSRLRDAFLAISGSGALWIFFASDFQWGSARTRTDSDCPKRVLDDPQRRHGHPMGQKKITQRGTIWQWARCVCTDTPNRCPRTHARPPRWDPASGSVLPPMGDSWPGLWPTLGPSRPRRDTESAHRCTNMHFSIGWGLGCSRPNPNVTPPHTGLQMSWGPLCTP